MRGPRPFKSSREQVEKHSSAPHAWHREPRLDLNVSTMQHVSWSSPALGAPNAATSRLDRNRQFDRRGVNVFWGANIQDWTGENRHSVMSNLPEAVGVGQVTAITGATKPSSTVAQKVVRTSWKLVLGERCPEHAAVVKHS